MHAVHLKFPDLHDDHECAFAEAIIGLLKGVEAVASIRSLSLVSVLYDDAETSVSEILSAVGRAGYRARAYPSTARRFAAAVS